MFRCESCHGPGREHVLSPTAANIINPAHLSYDAQLSVCGSCHARNNGHVSLSGRQDPIGFMPGDDVYDFTKVQSVVNNENVWAKTQNGEIVGYFDGESGGSQRFYGDGGARSHRMQFNDMESSHVYTMQRLTCTDCHNPHGVNAAGSSLKYENWDALREAQCSSCHAGATWTIDEVMPVRVRSSNTTDLRSHTFWLGGEGMPSADIPLTSDSD